MARSPVTCLPLLFALLASPVPLCAQHTVSGTVFDAGGVPIENAFVEARPTPNRNAGVIAGTHQWIQADMHGHFSVQLAPGHYKIVAKRESEGYPDPSFVFNYDRSASFPELDVENADITGVRVELGVKGGFLYGTLRTQRDRSPIPHGTVTIRDARNTAAYIELFSDNKGHFQLTVPSKAVLVSAAAPGHSGGKFANGQELTLLPGEQVSVIVELDQQ